MRSLSCFAILGLALPLSAENPKKHADLEVLQGEWLLVGLEVREQTVPPEKLEGTTLVIKKDKYTTIVKKKEYAASFTLDQKQDPKHIDMLIPDDFGTPRLSKGIYKVEGEKLIICRGQAPGGERPRNFVSSATNDVFVVTWERISKP